MGDEVTLIIPMSEDADWGAIEAVLPKFDEAKEPEEKRSSRSKKKDELDLDEELDI